MLEFAAHLFDTNGFTPRASSGDSWNSALIWMHVGGDLFLWLAFVSIPLVLLYFARRRADLPYRGGFFLFALFLLASGIGHLLEALMFEYPLFRLSGTWKVFTAAVAWAAVVALVPLTNRAVNRPGTPGGPARLALGDTRLHELAALPSPNRANDYAIAILAAVLALLVRASIDPIVRSDHFYILSLLAVVFVSWQCGFGPAMVTVFLSMLGMMYFFIAPTRSFEVVHLSNQMATAIFFFCGVCCAALGEAQHRARQASREALAVALEQKDALVAEVARRHTAEAEFRASEEKMRTFYDSSPISMGIVEPLPDDLRHVYDNRASCEFLGVPPGETTGRRGSELGTPHAVLSLWLEKYWESAAKGSSVHFEHEQDGPGGRRWLSVTVSPLAPGPDGQRRFCYVAEDVTGRRKADEALRESEGRFRSMADSAPALIWLSDMDRRRTYFNNTWLKFTGRTVEQEIGEGWVENLHPEDRDVYLNTYAEALAERKPFELEYRLRRHDGQYRWVLARGTPRFTSSGGFAGFVGFCLDVTDRKRADEDVRRSEARFRTLTEAIPQIVWTADPQGAVTFFNRRWDAYTGRPLGRSREPVWDGVVHPDDAARLRAEWQLAIAGQPDQFTHEFRLRRAADGAYRWMLSTAVPLRDQATRDVAEWVGSITDIDDQKRYAETLEQTVRDRTAALVEQVDERTRAEAEVRKQREFLDAILANVTDGIVACDESGTLTLFNRAAQEFHGLPPRALPPDQLARSYNLLRPDAVTPLTADEVPLLRALRGERVRDAEIVIAAPGGPPRTLLCNGQRLADADGHNLGAVVSMRDVTEQREADRQLQEAAAELRRANDELARSNGELEQFAYVASHDLQEPLRKIQAFGDLLTTKVRSGLPDVGKEYVDRMLVSAGRMRRLIDDLLTFSRVTTQARPFVPLDLGRLVREVVSDLSARLDQTGGEVRVGELPAIDADHTQMRQVFQNLIANALKFHRPGVPPVVEVSAELGHEPDADGQPVRVCRVAVRDNGIGFNEKYLDRIFQMFQRLHGREEYEGTGVGLAICHKIIVRHGGSITARSRPGEGATFIITLPVHHPNPPDADGPSSGLRPG